MKLCFSTLACPSWSLGQIFEAAENYGIRGIDFRGLGHEIDITKLPAFTSEIDSTLSELHRHGLEMPCLNTSVTLVTPAPERWEMMLDECQRYARLAERTATPYLRIFGGAVPKTMTRDEARMLGRRHLRQLEKVCRAHGCMVVLETHDAWSTSSEVLELLGEFDPAETGALWDVEHPYRHGEAPLATAQSLGKYLRHVHIKDSLRVGDTNTPKLMGEGDLPLREMLGAMKAVGYDGWVCLETEKRWIKESPDPEASLPQFAEFIRGHWALEGGSRKSEQAT